MALFSATMPEWVAKLQQKFLKDPVKVAITPATGTQSTIEQIAYQVPQDQKIAALCTLLNATKGESTLIFGRTKFGVEKLGKQLSKLGFTVGTLHGNKSQRAREDVLTAFRRGQVQTLLATNVAARGLDIQGIYQVINYELPESSDLFTHRIGRTGRMGRQGKAITLLAPADVPKWRRMARNLGQAVLLQRLIIDEEVSSAVPYATAEVASMLEREQYNEQRPVRNSRPSFAPDQDRGRRGRPEHDSHRAPDFKRRQKEHAINETPAWQSEDAALPVLPHSNEIRDDRRGARKQSSMGRNAGKHRARSFATTEAHQPDRRRSGAPTRRVANRSASYYVLFVGRASNGHLMGKGIGGGLPCWMSVPPKGADPYRDF